MKKVIGITLTLCTIMIACAQQKTKTVAENKTEVAVVKTTQEQVKDSTLASKPYSEYTDADWKKVLTSEQYYILRQKGTERPFMGKLLGNKKKGVYVCAACKTPLYKSETKFKSGTGWPSFFDEIDDNVKEIADNSLGITRTEIVCGTCDGHLGHVFNDGPQPTGLRHCVNSVSLAFEEQ